MKKACERTYAKTQVDQLIGRNRNPDGLWTP